MLDEISFGEFIAVKRKQAGYTITGLANALSLSSTYLCNVEHGARPAPSYDIMVMMACLLELNDADRFVMFDLAAKTKNRITIPQDILNYIEHDSDVCLFLRIAGKQKISGKQLLELINGK